MPIWSSVPPSPQGVLNDTRGDRRRVASDDEVFYTGPGDDAAVKDARHGYHGGYVVDHLITWMVEPDDDIVEAPEKALKRLHGLETQPRNELSVIRCSLSVTAASVDVIDNQSGEIFEQFPLDVVDTPFASTCNPSEHIYNNVLMFYVLQEQSGMLAPYELHVFQVLGCPARDIAMSLDQAKQQRSALRVPRKSMAPDMNHISRSNGDQLLRNEALPIRGSNATPDTKRQSAAVSSDPRGQRQQQKQQHKQQQQQKQQQQSEPSVHPKAAATSLPGNQTENYVLLLNKAFDDIEQFTLKLQQISQRTQLNRYGKHGDRGTELAPSPQDYMDIFQKFKLSLNILGLVKSDIRNPNASELAHFLFDSLSFVVATAPDQENFAARVVSPLLLMEAINLLMNCLSSKEHDIWMSLGPAWTLARKDWESSSPVIPYRPKFYDGWEPPLAWLQPLNGQPAVTALSVAAAAPAVDGVYRQRTTGNADDSQAWPQQKVTNGDDRRKSRGIFPRYEYTGRPDRQDESNQSRDQWNRSGPSKLRAMLPETLTLPVTSSPKLARLRLEARGGQSLPQPAYSDDDWHQAEANLNNGFEVLPDYEDHQPMPPLTRLGNKTVTVLLARDDRRQNVQARQTLQPSYENQQIVSSTKERPGSGTQPSSYSDQLPSDRIAAWNGLLQQKRPGNTQQEPLLTAEQVQQRFIAELITSGATMCEVTFDFRANNQKELSVTTGDVVEILDDSRKWWLCRNAARQEGYVPFTALQKYESAIDTSIANEASPTHVTRGTQPHFIPPPPPPGPPPPLQQAVLNAKKGLKQTGNAAKVAPPRKVSDEALARQTFDSELKTQLAEFRKGNWGLSERALRASLSAISAGSSVKEVTKWLNLKGFSEQTKYALRSCSGQDLFGMSNDELVQQLGSEDGNRLAHLLSTMRRASVYNPGPPPPHTSTPKLWQGQAGKMQEEDLPIDY